jgi:opacity protein-like surface antigen
MKKLLCLAALLPTVTLAGEAPFTGGFLGGEINFNKQDFSIPYDELGYGYYFDGKYTAKSSNTTGFAVLGGYGFDYGNDFIGIIEGKLSVTGTKVKGERLCYRCENGKIAREYLNVSTGYLQGYRITDRVLPYVKVSLNTAVLDVKDLPYNSSRVSKEDDITGVYGFGYGFGAKVALNSDLELGAEWLKTDMRGSNHLKVKNKTVGVNLVYKF